MRANHRGARTYILDKIENELDGRYHYHNIVHSKINVMNAAITFAKASSLRTKEMALLKTAVAYHDSGLLDRHHDHELGGIMIVQETLPKFGYVSEEIKIISDMILATRLPQTPQTYLEALMADADLSVVGRRDFIGRDQDLRKELLAFGTTYSDIEWLELQIKFLDAHTFHTFVARNLCYAQKEENIAYLKKALIRQLKKVRI